ncbi:aldo/keto reductase [Neisseria animalis]|uniref:Oxidoreductase n=1 Tax=Neisseria animalis TaxID=492 RepID=A0A5P3MS67_NEIAN|nr:aldo/keto reductase [Neisseria animalis]QEY24457.1 oxidoreductase [Neisseria animalis]ROW31943.1 oxidoreductase [Neisseria animalis]VEE07106.1 Oxidoreductase YdhF [Neisseria animalis]
MEFHTINGDLRMSRLVHGYWRAHEWGLDAQGYLRLIEEVLASGIDTFDHAACYGGFVNEGQFGAALKLDKSLRRRMTIVSKCGISFPNAALPEMKSKHYDNSAAHIIWSAERSVRELGCEYLDLLLLHRPSPFLNPEEVAAAFDNLNERGLVRYFGVSNYTAQKLSMLQSYVKQPLATNQIEISPLHIEPFADGSVDYLLEKRMKPMAWSPLAGGKLFAADDERSRRVASALLEAGEAHGETRLDTLAYAWLLNHSSGIMPIVGSGKIERIRNAADALGIRFDDEAWIKVYAAALGHNVP